MQTKKRLSRLLFTRLKFVATGQKSLAGLLPILSLVTCYLLLVSTFPSPTHAQFTSWSEENKCVVDGVATIQGFECLLQNTLAVAITLIGIVIIIMLVIGSYKLITSGGDPKAVEAGKQTITYAVAGLVFALSAWFIINTISTFTGSQDIKIFKTQHGYPLETQP